MKRAKTILVTILVATVVISGAAYGVYWLSGTNLFDSSGDYITEIVDDNDTIKFMEDAEAVSYLDLINSEGNEDFKGKPLKYWGYITSKDVGLSGSVKYTMNIILNKEDTKRCGDKYTKNENGLALAEIIFKVGSNYANFVIGDYVWMYGTLDKLVETDGGNRVPYFEARKIVLDLEI